MFLFHNSALAISNQTCAKNVIFASEIKRLVIKSINSNKLSDCKYHVLNSKRLFSYYFKKEKYCFCITENDLDIQNLLSKAENAVNLDLCINYSYKFIHT